MPTQEITVQFVNPVKPGKKWGSIKTSEGQMFGCPPTMLKLFSPGEVCTVEIENWDSGGAGIKKKLSTAKAPPLSPPPRQRTNPVDTENMFVTACLKSFIEAGKVELHAVGAGGITDAVAEIKKAYRLSSTERQRSDELDDEVGF